MAITLRQLRANVEVRGLREFEGDLDKSVSAVRRWGDGIRKAAKLAAGALAVAETAMNGVVAITASAADSTLRLARNLGFTTRQLTAYQIAARIAGTSVQALLSAQQTLEQNVQSLVQGNEVLAQTFFFLGIRVTDVNGQFLPLNQIFGQALRSLSAIPDPATRAAAAFRLFGTEADSVLSIIDLGPRRVDELALAADRLGITLDTRAAMGARELTLNLRLLREVVLGIGRTIAVALAPVLNDTVVLILRLIAANSNLIRTGLTRWLPIVVNSFRFLRAELLRGVATVFTFATEAIPAAIAAITQLATNLLPVLFVWIGRITGTVAGATVGALRLVGDVLLVALGLLTQLAETVGPPVVDFLGKTWQWLTALDGPLDRFRQLFGAISIELQAGVLPALAGLLSTLAQLIGELAGPVLQTLNDWLGKLRDLAVANKNIAAAIGAVAVITLVGSSGFGTMLHTVAGVIDGLGSFAGAIGIVIFSLTKLLGSLLLIPAAVGILVFAFQKWVLGADDAAAATEALKWGLVALAVVIVGQAIVAINALWAAIQANPIGVVLTALIGLFVFLIAKQDEMQAWWEGFFDWLFAKWDAFVNWLSAKWKWLVSKVNPWAQASPSMVDNFETGLQAIADEFDNAFNETLQSWQQTVDRFQGPLNELVNDKLGTAAGSIRQQLEGAFTDGAAAFDDLKRKIEGGIQFGRTDLEGIAGMVGAATGAGGGGTPNAFKDARRTFGEQFVRAAGGGLFSGIGASANIENKLRELLDSLEEGTPLFDRFNAKFGQLVQLARDVGEARPEQVLGIQKQFDAILDTIQKPGGFVAGLQAARSKLEELADTVDPSGKLRTKLDSLVSDLLTAAPDAFDRAREALERFLNRLKRAALRGDDDDGRGSGRRDPFTNFGPNVFVQMQQAMQLPFLIGRQLTAFAQQFAIGVNAFTRGTVRFDQASDFLLRELGVLAHRNPLGQLIGYSTNLPLFFTTVSSISHTQLGPGQGISDIPIGNTTNVNQSVTANFPNAQIDANTARAFVREIERQLKTAGRLQPNDAALRLRRQ